MNTPIFLICSGLTILIIWRAWCNTLSRSRQPSTRNVWIAVFWMLMAIVLPVYSYEYFHINSQWAWLIIIVATNGLAMQGMDEYLGSTKPEIKACQ